jgi:hypothetical protein
MAADTVNMAAVVDVGVSTVVDESNWKGWTT